MKTVKNTALPVLVKRNVKCFFKDKGMFFTSLITPLILLVLYATFLYKVYADSFRSSLPAGVVIGDKALGGLVGGLLLSSLLAVSSVTVSFCANLAMVQDRVTGADKDFAVSPVKPHTVALGYYLATVMNALIIGIVTAILGFTYLAFTGWYLSALDILAIVFDIFLLVMFGTALSSLICYPLTSQGQLSAVGSIVSSTYGFICGAYMPISQFSTGLQRVLMFFPGTYGTSLIRNHALRGVCAQMRADGLPQEAIDGFRKVADCDLSFFSHKVEIWAMYLIVIGTIAVILGAYIVLQAVAEKKRLRAQRAQKQHGADEK